MQGIKIKERNTRDERSIMIIIVVNKEGETETYLRPGATDVDDFPFCPAFGACLHLEFVFRYSDCFQTGSEDVVCSGIS